MPTFVGSRGRIFHDSWQPDGAVRGAVVLLHGYGEHLGLYDPLARRLVTDGLAVHAMDAVGHGRSDGERAVIPSWGEFAEDACRLGRIPRHGGHGPAGTTPVLNALEITDRRRAMSSGVPLSVTWGPGMGRDRLA